MKYCIQILAIGIVTFSYVHVSLAKVVYFGGTATQSSPGLGKTMPFITFGVLPNLEKPTQINEVLHSNFTESITFRFGASNKAVRTTKIIVPGEAIATKTHGTFKLKHSGLVTIVTMNFSGASKAQKWADTYSLTITATKLTAKILFMKGGVATTTTKFSGNMY